MEHCRELNGQSNCAESTMAMTRYVHEGTKHRGMALLPFQKYLLYYFIQIYMQWLSLLVVSRIKLNFGVNFWQIIKTLILWLFLKILGNLERFWKELGYSGNTALWGLTWINFFQALNKKDHKGPGGSPGGN